VNIFVTGKLNSLMIYPTCDIYSESSRSRSALMHNSFALTVCREVLFDTSFKLKNWQLVSTRLLCHAIKADKK